MRNEERYTTSGIPVKAFYTAEDLKDPSYVDEVNDPGKYPFTRGIFPLGYRQLAWQNAQASGYGLPEETNARERYLTKKGQSGFDGRISMNLTFDNVCQNGYDSDNPLGKYEVGSGGVFINCLRDAELLFEGFDLSNLNVGFIIDTPGPIILAIYIALADKWGIPRERLRGIVCNSPWRRYYSSACLCFVPEDALRIAADCIVWSAKHVPNFNTYSLNGYCSREAGATATQEMAIAIAPGIQVAEQCIKMGAQVDDFIDKFNFFLAFNNNLFEEVAKIRAGRKLWARIVRERLGAKKDKSCWMKIHLQTAASTLTAQEPYNNIARVAIQCLGGVMAGVQSMHTNSYDEAISIPSEDAVRVAVKTQKIIEHESGLTDVVDPLGGSYYVEYLTNEMEKGIQEYLDKIQAMGGFTKAIDNGYIEQEVANAALGLQREIETGKRIIVGLNEYVEEEPIRVPPFRVNPATREIETERLERWKRERNSSEVQDALEAIRQAAIQGDALMPRYVEAARVGATMGEMMGVLTGVFRVYQYKNLLATV